MFLHASVVREFEGTIKSTLLNRDPLWIQIDIMNKDLKE